MSCRLAACGSLIDKMLSLPESHPQTMPRSANRAIISRRGTWVVPVDVGPAAGSAADPRTGDAGEQRCDDVFPEGEQGADDPGGTG